MTRILLVHGALADGSSWSKVISHLQGRGYKVTAVQQPLLNIEEDIKIVKATIQTLNDINSDPIVIVGHSFGGLVMSNAATGAANVKALVYVQAFALDENESVGSVTANFPQVTSTEHFIPDSSGRIYLEEDDYVKHFAVDVPVTEARVLAAAQGPCDTARFGFQSGKPAWKELQQSLYYIIGDNDQVIHPKLQYWFAKRMNAKSFVLKGASHAGLISQAEKVAKVIVEAAEFEESRPSATL
jgi:pimeloyl-ACP methyl ester carboxylesterase